MWEIPDTHQKFQNHLDGLENQCQLVSSFWLIVAMVLGVMASTFIFGLVALSYAKLRNDHPKINTHLV